MPPPPIIQSLWIGAPLSKLEQLTIQSFLHHGHAFHLYTYAKVGNIPAGTVVKNGGDILPPECIFRDDHGSVAGFSDWFRYALLAKRGGFYVDMDTVCIKPFQFDADSHRTDIIVGLEKPGLAGTAVIGIPKNPDDHPPHEIFARLRDACATFPKIMPWDSNKTKLRKLRRMLSLKRAREDVRYGSVGGPLPFTDALRYFDLLKSAKSPHTFFPIQSPDWHSIFDETFANGFPSHADTFALQWWNSRAAKHPDFDKNANFPRASLIEQLKREYNLAN